MADTAWMEVHALGRGGFDGDEIRPLAIQEAHVTTFEAFTPTNLADFRVALGIQTILTMANADRVYVTETFDQIAALVKLKK